MMETIIDILTRTSGWELLFIFFAKIVEVTLGTLRMILINKGYRKYGVVLAVIEIFLWVFVASQVITGLSESPMKGVAYGLGFAAGVYFGSTLEEKLAFGKVLIQAIVPHNLSETITNSLREHDFGVTILDAKGKDLDRTVLMIYVNRRDIKMVVKYIKDIDEHAMIISNESVNLSGGYTRKIKHIFK